MSPSANTMRDFVYQMYKGEGWHRRVRRMTDSQIMAIYLKQQERIVREELARKKTEGHDTPF